MWEVEARISFTGREGPVKASLITPGSTKRFTVLDQRFVSSGYGLSTGLEEGNRLATLSRRTAPGEQTLYYRFLVHVGTSLEPRPPTRAPEIQRPKWEGAKLEAAQGLLGNAEERSADLPTLVGALLRQLNATPLDDNAKLLLGKAPTAKTKAEVAAGILGLGKYAARSVTGVRLAPAQRQARYVYWLEAYLGERWHGFDVITAAPEVPADYFPWWRGTSPLVRVEGGERLGVQIAVARASEATLQTALAVGRAKEEKLLEFSLLNLPLDVQQVYRVLLVIPIGALLLVILRNVVGVTTFGTFMPVLIALAFRETQLLWGIVLFTAVVGIGLAVRLYFENLKLLVVPRLASVLIVVIVSMILLSLLAHKLGFERGLSIALFPMVILTMTVERMSVVWDERGPAESLKQGIGSLIVAVLCFLVMTIPYAEHVLFVFPELLLVLLALTLLLGRYSGYRLLELLRFRELVGKGT